MLKRVETKKNNPSGIKNNVAAKIDPSKIKLKVKNLDNKSKLKQQTNSKNILIKKNKHSEKTPEHTGHEEAKTFKIKKENQSNSLNFNADENMNNNNKAKQYKTRIKQKMDLHLSLNLNETMQSLKDGGGFLEISSGLVPLKRQKNSAFHISFDENSPMNESGVRIRNQIFGDNDEWNFKKTTPGRYEQLASVEKVPLSKFTDYESSGVDFSYSPINIDIKNGDFVISSIASDDYNNKELNASSESSMSFLFNQHTGFLCKNCFSSACVHIQNITRLSEQFYSQKKKKKKKDKISSKIKKRRKKSIKKPKEKNDVLETQLDRCFGENKVEDNVSNNNTNTNESENKSLVEKPELESLLVPFLKQVNESYLSEMSISDFFSLLEFNKSILRDSKPKTTHILNDAIDDLNASDVANKNAKTQSSLVDLKDNANSNNQIEITNINNNNDKDDLSKNDELKIQPQKERPGSKNSFNYDSDYDDASYLDACHLSKSQISFEELDIYLKLKEVGKETSQREVITPPNLSSTPNDSFLKTNFKKRRASLRPPSDLQPVIESEEQYTSRSSILSGSSVSKILSQRFDKFDFLEDQKKTLVINLNNNSSTMEQIYINILEASNPSDLRGMVKEKIEQEKIVETTHPVSEVHALDQAKTNENSEKLNKINESNYARLSLKELKKLAKRHLNEYPLTNNESGKTLNQAKNGLEFGHNSINSQRVDSALSATAFKPFQPEPSSCEFKSGQNKVRKRSVIGECTIFAAISSPSRSTIQVKGNNLEANLSCNQTKLKFKNDGSEDYLDSLAKNNNINCYETPSEQSHINTNKSDKIFSEEQKDRNSIIDDDDGYTPDQDEQLQLKLQELRMNALNESYFNEQLYGSDKDTHTDDEEVNQINQIGNQTSIFQRKDFPNSNKEQETVFVKSFTEQSTNTEYDNSTKKVLLNANQDEFNKQINTLFFTDPHSNLLKKEKIIIQDNQFERKKFNVQSWLSQNCILEDDSGVDSGQERTINNSYRDSQHFKISKTLDMKNSNPCCSSLPYNKNIQAQYPVGSNLAYRNTRDPFIDEKNLTSYRNHYTNTNHSSFTNIKNMHSFLKNNCPTKESILHTFPIDYDSHFSNNLPFYAYQTTGSTNNIFIPRPPSGSNKRDSYIQRLSARSRDNITKSPSTIYINTIDDIKSSPKSRNLFWQPLKPLQTGRWRASFGPSWILEDETSSVKFTNFDKITFSNKFLNDMKRNHRMRRKLHHERHLFIQKATHSNDEPLYLTKPCRTLKSRRCQYADNSIDNKNRCVPNI